MSTTTHMTASDLLPSLQRCFPTCTSYKVLATITQASAIGYKIQLAHDKQESTTDSSCCPSQVFCKQVVASNYVATKKDWPDLRRALLYARNEGRFYQEYVPKLRARGFHSYPTVYYADYALQGWIEEDEPSMSTTAANGVVKEDLPDPELKGGLLILECLAEEDYFQDSPLTLPQAKACLTAAADLHAAAWQDADLLESAATRLSRASFHLSMRNPKELAGMEASWKAFSTEFQQELVDANLWTPSVQDLGRRIQEAAQTLSDLVSVSPTDPYATLIHGDYKSMNVFLPRNDNGNKNAVLVDFASTGIGLGMCDVAMHIHHAVVPEDLAHGGEEALVQHYWETLVQALPGGQEAYPREVAMRHYKLACLDYFRFFLGRMWKSATHATMAQKGPNKNVNLINRSIPAAVAFIGRVDQYMTELQDELLPQTADSTLS